MPVKMLFEGSYKDIITLIMRKQKSNTPITLLRLYFAVTFRYATREGF